MRWFEKRMTKKADKAGKVISHRSTPDATEYDAPRPSTTVESVYNEPDVDGYLEMEGTSSTRIKGIKYRIQYTKRPMQMKSEQ